MTKYLSCKSLMSAVQTPLAKSKTMSKSTTKKRSKGELTREKILLATIEVLAVNGIKGTTHRAIASHANIQLSLTTYYFKDINELIEASFQLNSECLKAKNSIVMDVVCATLKNLDKATLEKTHVKEDICEKLTQMTADYLFSNVQQDASNVAVEQLMNSTIKTSFKFKEIAQAHEKSKIEPFTKLAGYFNNVDPDIDARMMRTVFSQLQYHQLSLTPDERSIEPMIKVIRKLLGWIMGLKT